MNVVLAIQEDLPVTQTRRLRARRVSRDLSQQAAADRIGDALTRDALSRIELGEQWPTPPQFLALARFYGVAPEDIFVEALEAWLSRHPEDQP
jgi:transcriptional regulator with XRE-family HTH domain